MKSKITASFAPMLLILSSVTSTFAQEQTKTINSADDKEPTTQPVYGSETSLVGPKSPKLPIAKNARVLSLEEAQKLAASRNYNMKNIEETIVQADAMIGTAWSMLLPYLDLKGSITLNQQEIKFQFPNFYTMQIDLKTGRLQSIEMMDIVLQEQWGKSFGASAYLTLLNPQAFPLIKNAYDNADLTRLNAKAQKNELLFAVTSVYYQVYTAKEIIAVYQENLARSEDFVRTSEARVKAGQGTNIDVLRAKLGQMSAQKALSDALDGLTAAKKTLAYLIGVESEPIDIMGPEQVKPIILDDKALKEKALSSRVEISAIEKQQTMAERSKFQTHMKWLPVFDVTYLWSWNSATGFSGTNNTWMLIFGARWNLFDGGGRIAEYKSRSSQIRMVDNALNQKRREISEQVEQLSLSIRKQQRNIELADRQVEIAEESRRQIARQYDVGLATSLEVNAAETELANAKVSRVIQRLSYDVAVLALQKAIGEYSSLATE